MPFSVCLAQSRHPTKTGRVGCVFQSVPLSGEDVQVSLAPHTWIGIKAALHHPCSDVFQVVLPGETQALPSVSSQDRYFWDSVLLSISGCILVICLSLVVEPGGQEMLLESNCRQREKASSEDSALNCLWAQVAEAGLALPGDCPVTENRLPSASWGKGQPWLRPGSQSSPHTRFAGNLSV